MRIPIPSGDGLKWVAAGCALVATASAEYEIARAIGMNEWVAAAVPGALDAYVLRALRAHREVLTAVLAMIGVNAASHLLTAGLLPLDWMLVTAVSAIAPLVLWRVHALGTPGEWRERKIWGPSTEQETEHADTVSVPAVPPLPVRVPGESLASTGTCPCEHTDTGLLCVCSLACSVPCFDEAEGQPCSCGATVWGDLGAHQRVPGHPSTFEEHANTAVSLASTPDHEPFPYTWDDTSTAGTPVLKLVPDPATVLTDTSTDQGHVSTGVLHPSDTVFLERARVLAGLTGGVPGVRALKSELSTGTARAQRLVAALTIEHARAQEGGTP